MTAPNWAIDALTTRQIEHLATGVTAGRVKPTDLSEAASVVWDHLAAEAEATRAKGLIVEVDSDPDFPAPGDLHPVTDPAP